MLSLEGTPQGTILPVKAHPGSRRNGILGTHDGALRLAVSQAPEKGKANTALIKLLAEILGLSKNRIELVSGETSPHKKFLIRGLAVEELSATMTTLLCEHAANSK
jgi:uncharacterized protein (TIGR00251 family)